MSEAAHGEEKHAPASGGGGAHGGGGGHSSGPPHGAAHEEHEGAPEWLISFADNVALLMGFFVILLAMNMGPKATPVQGGEQSEVDPAMEAIISIRKAFNTPDFDPDNPEEAKILRYLTRKNLGNANDDGIPGTNPNVQAIRPGEFKAVTAAITFDEKSSVLSPSGRQTLSEVAGKLRDQRWVVEVRGHVSPFEEMRDSLKGMDLSHARAKAVAQALVEEGIRWENLRLVACGSYDRVVARTYDAQQDRSNQRVEIVVTNETVQPDYYSQPDKTEEDKSQASAAPAHSEPHDAEDPK
jgi:flagellar motor protein MotB